jgi:mannitol/fructose-specific phosphotransferase system IIA component (Ntr-type)
MDNKGVLEEEKQSRVHLDIANRIVDKLADE